MRDSGRPCGCDPAAGHPCSQHAAHVDTSELRVVDNYGGTLIVSGPDDDGEFMLAIEGGMVAGEGYAVHVERFVLEDIIHELERRLTERA